MSHKNKSCEDNGKKFEKLLKKMLKTSKERGLSDWEFLDQIPDSEICDDHIPLPYGGGNRSFDLSTEFGDDSG